ncbi:uncharacterized methyltransferase at2g41040 chloroplastic [Phtheirospermum japonicum]|uniref:Uncharacterized methyltransferase at2g41040 chloroplastic n=1 Tax=Phtheirospermum japonicum TaxID=374723 RepID=A0A830CZ42_9LAMI|nr:uncharacterized methyltransferase at2g41040 chloroplastic [Phtheirospermum japonicum]
MKQNIKNFINRNKGSQPLSSRIMATVAQPSIRLHQNSNFIPINPRLFSRNSRICPHPVCSTARIRASSVVALGPEPITEAKNSSGADLFACPICYEPLIRKGPSGFNLPAIYRSGFKCRMCNKSYSSKNVYLDLTVTSGTKEYNEFKPAGTEIFRSPLVSFVYERGWRQNFNRSGFPGPDEEFNMSQKYFKPSEGGVLVDVSCGSGLFSRKFAISGAYSRVIALDYSENMLRQCFDFIKNDDTILSSSFALVRADVSRLPFSSGSIDAVHAGAALHCWPSPSNAVKGLGASVVADQYASDMITLDKLVQDIYKGIMTKLFVLGLEGSLMQLGLQILTLTSGHDLVQKLTLIPRWQARGLTWLVPIDDPLLMTRKQLFARIIKSQKVQLMDLENLTRPQGDDSQRATSHFRSKVAEINRILRSGGVFVGSTFLRVSSSTPFLLKAFKTVPENLLSETDLGKFKCEYPVKKGIFLAAKSYNIQTQDGQRIIKQKGISKSLVDQTAIH